MVVEMFSEKRSQVQNWMWRRRFERMYGARAGLVGDGGRIHFILGLADGGADHLARLISRPGTSVRFYNAFMAKFEPKLVFSKKSDPLAIPYHRTLERSHPIFRVYRLLVEPNNEWIARGMSNRIPEAEMAKAPCLIKETRGLLATEGLLDGLKAKTLLFVGDPVKSVDRLFEQHGLHTNYLKSEAGSVLSPYFLARFLRRDYDGVIQSSKKIRQITDRRRRTILHRTLIVALIQHMFRRLSLRYPKQVVLAEYDQLAQNPPLLQEMLERLMGAQGREIGRKTLEAASMVPVGKKESMWRDAWPDIKPGYGFITEEEADACYEMLRDAGLGVGVRERAQEEPVPSEKMVEEIYAQFLDASNG